MTKEQFLKVGILQRPSPASQAFKQGWQVVVQVKKKSLVSSWSKPYFQAGQAAAWRFLDA